MVQDLLSLARQGEQKFGARGRNASSVVLTRLLLRRVQDTCLFAEEGHALVQHAPAIVFLHDFGPGSSVLHAE